MIKLNKYISILFLITSVYGVNKTGTTAKNYNDAGIVYYEGAPLFIISAYTDGVEAELPNGEPGHTVAYDLTARLARLCYDAFLD